MSPSAPIRVWPPERGFTLLELMVVVIIVGVITTLAVLSLGDSVARRLDEEAYRFASLIRLANDEAVLQSHEIGLEIKREGYAFHQYDDQLSQWLPMTGNPVYRERKLTKGMTLDLRLEDQDMVLPDLNDENDDEEQDAAQPQILILSSGEMSPFELIFEFEDTELVLKAQSNGSVETQAER